MPPPPYPIATPSASGSCESGLELVRVMGLVPTQPFAVVASSPVKLICCKCGGGEHRVVSGVSSRFLVRGGLGLPALLRVMCLLPQERGGVSLCVAPGLFRPSGVYPLETVRVCSVSVCVSCQMSRVRRARSYLPFGVPGSPRRLSSTAGRPAGSAAGR